MCAVLKTKVRAACSVNTSAADALVTQETNATAAMQVFNLDHLEYSGYHHQKS